LLAFLEAFREANEACWAAVVARLKKLKDAEDGKTNPERLRLLSLMLEEFRERGHFAAVEVQAGPAFRRKSMQWHKDGATGLLHMGITLGGCRSLKFRARGGDEWRSEEVKMSPGHIYISSPFLYDHSVSYDTSSNGGGPILALMCRFGFLAEEDAHWVNHLRSQHMLEITELIANCLKEAADDRKLRLPTMTEIRRMEHEYAKE